MLEGRCQRKRRMIGLLSEAREAPGWRLSFPISDTCRYMVALTPPPRGRATPLGSCWPTFKFALSRNKFLNQIVFLPFATKLLRLCFHRRESVHGGGGWCLVPGGCTVPGGCPFLGGAWSPGGFLFPGGLLPGVWCFSQHALRQTPLPRERRLLLRTVRIPLECILVLVVVLSKTLLAIIAKYGVLIRA